MILLRKAVITAVILVFTHFYLPLSWNPKLLISSQILILIVATLILLLSQERLSYKETVKNKSLDKGTTFWIFTFASLGLVLSLIEWSILRNPEGIWTWNLPNTIGLFLLLSGLGFRIYVLQILGKNFSATVQLKANQQLITYGPYSRIRHPSYTGAWLYFIGFGLFLNAISGFFLFTFGLFSAYNKRIKAEEKALIKHFGGQYLQYRVNTHRMIPGLW